MSRHLFQTTDSAFSPSTSIPESAWRTVSTHTSALAACKAARADQDAMRRYCGSQSWTHHVRVVHATSGRVVSVRDVMEWADTVKGWSRGSLPASKTRLLAFAGRYLTSGEKPAELVAYDAAVQAAADRDEAERRAREDAAYG